MQGLGTLAAASGSSVTTKNFPSLMVSDVVILDADEFVQENGEAGERYEREEEEEEEWSQVEGTSLVKIVKWDALMQTCRRQSARRQRGLMSSSIT